MQFKIIKKFLKNEYSIFNFTDLFTIVVWGFTYFYFGKIKILFIAYILKILFYIMLRKIFPKTMIKNLVFTSYYLVIISLILVLYSVFL